MANDVKLSGKSVKLKSNYKVLTKHDAFYTGGKIQFSSNQEVVFCSCAEKVRIVNVDTGKVIQTISEEGDIISCFAISPDDEVLVTSSKNLQLKHWNWKNGKCTRSWKAINKGPISCMVFDCTSTLLATGSSDSTIKIWDVVKQYYTHNFKGSQGVASIVCFHPDKEKLQLFSASDDCKIRIWDLHQNRCMSVLEGHFSVVTSLAFQDAKELMISSGRDNVINIWDLSNRKLSKTLPSFESVETVLILPACVSFPGCSKIDNRVYFLTCGAKGIIRIFDLDTRKCIFQQPVHKNLPESNDSEEAPSHSIVNATLCQNIEAVAIVTADHNILLYSYDGLEQVKQFVGYNDEILDMKFLGSSEHHAVVATNSSQVRLYDLTTMDCQLLVGHSDIVLCLDVHHFGNLLVTGSKDNTIRIWKRQETGKVVSVGLGQGHTHAVRCVAWSRTKKPFDFVVSGSQDLTIKLWCTRLEWQEGDILKLSVQLTEKAHDKDINSIAVSPNDKLIATGSQDKTAKIWRTSDLALLGTMRGHRRGIWCVQFSPVDQCLATGSADSVIRLWALHDFMCLKTLEGHSNSVLQISFLSRGMQLISSGSDGLIKLWTIKTNECIKTIDEHEDKVWSLALSDSEQTMLTGGADSVLNIWKDVTKEEEDSIRIAAEDQLMKEQELSNLLHRKQFTKAVGLALTLDQPLRTLNIIKDILFLENGSEKLASTLRDLRDDQVDSMLRFLCDWNTNAKHSYVSQTVLSLILKQHSPDWLIERPDIKERIEALLPYTERHFERMNRLLQQSMFVDYTWQAMKLSSPTDMQERSAGEDLKMPDDDSLGKAGDRDCSRECPYPEDAVQDDPCEKQESSPDDNGNVIRTSASKLQASSKLKKKESGATHKLKRKCERSQKAQRKKKEKQGQ